MLRTTSALHLRLTPADRARLGALLSSALTLAVTAVVFLVLDKPFFSHYSGYDEEYFSWGGWCITKGLVPYRDFHDFKPPMVFVTHALAIALFGLKRYGFRTFFVLAPLAAILALQIALLRRGIDRILTLAVIGAFLCLFLNPLYHDTALSDAESIVVMYYVFGLAAFLWEGPRRAITRALGGFCLSCAVFSKEPCAGIVLATWCGMFWLRGDGSRADARLFARQSLLGVGAFAVLLCLYLVPTGAMAHYVDLIRSYPRVFRDPKTSFCVAAGIARPDDGLAVAWDRLRAVFFNQATLGFLTPLAIPGAVFAFQRSSALFSSMVGALVAGLWAAAATNCMWIHYCVMSMAGVLYVLVVAADSLRKPLALASSRVRTAANVAAVVIVGWALAPALTREYHAEYTRIPWQEPQPGLMSFIARHTKPTDRIFTTGTPALYAQSDRLSAVVQSAFLDEFLPSYPGATDEERLRVLRDQLVRNRPKIVFIDPEHESHKARHLALLVYPFLREFNYRAVNERLYVRP